MTQEWRDFFDPLRNEASPTFDVRLSVLRQLARHPARVPNDSVLSWLTVGSLAAAILVWGAILPGLIQKADARGSYVAMVESLDVTSDLPVPR